MRKQEFLGELRKGLSGLPQGEIEERLIFYSEMIDDRMEDGLTEDKAVAMIGKAEDVVLQILSEIPLSGLVKERVKPKRTLRVWEIVLLVLGSPIWLSLLIAFFVVVLSVYIVIWSVVISLWAIAVAVAGCAVGGMISSVVFMLQGNLWSGIAMLGAGIACIGLAIFLFAGCKAATKGVILLTKKCLISIKSWFLGKGGNDR